MSIIRQVFQFPNEIHVGNSTVDILLNFLL